MELCQAIIILSAFCLMFIMKGVSFANDNPFGKALISYEARSGDITCATLDLTRQRDLPRRSP